MNQSVVDLVNQLLNREVTTRLGNRKTGIEEIKGHPWYTDAKFDWLQLEQRGLKAPYVPKIKDPLDTSNFESFPYEPPVKPYRGDNSLFADF